MTRVTLSGVISPQAFHLFQGGTLEHLEQVEHIILLNNMFRFDTQALRRLINLGKAGHRRLIRKVRGYLGSRS